MIANFVNVKYRYEIHHWSSLIESKIDFLNRVGENGGFLANIDDSGQCIFVYLVSTETTSDAPTLEQIGDYLAKRNLSDAIKDITASLATISPLMESFKSDGKLGE